MQNENISQANLDALLASFSNREEDVPVPEQAHNAPQEKHTTPSMEIDQSELDALLAQDSDNSGNTQPNNTPRLPHLEFINDSAPAADENFIPAPSMQIDQTELDNLLGTLISIATKDTTDSGAGMNQAALDALLAGFADNEVFADTPEEVQALAAAKPAEPEAEDTDIDQAELDALLAAMSEDEPIADGPPPKPGLAKTPKPESTGKGEAPKAEKVLSQEEIDAMLAALGG